MVTKKNSRSPWAWIPTLYFAEGLPNVIVTALSVVMYMQLGLTDAEVGLYTGWLALPWVIKPLWSPFIDLLKTKRWWVLTMQALIGAALAGIAFSLPTAFWVHELKKLPNFINVFFKYQPDNEIERISDELENVIEDLTNTRNKVILHNLNLYPILATKAHTRPFERQWLNILAAIIVPVGIVLYLRMWRFRIRLYRDLNTIRQSNANIISQIKEM